MEGCIISWGYDRTFHSCFIGRVIIITVIITHVFILLHKTCPRNMPDHDDILKARHTHVHVQFVEKFKDWKLKRSSEHRLCSFHQIFPVHWLEVKTVHWPVQFELQRRETKLHIIFSYGNYLAYQNYTYVQLKGCSY